MATSQKQDFSVHILLTGFKKILTVS